MNAKKMRDDDLANLSIFIQEMETGDVMKKSIVFDDIMSLLKYLNERMKQKQIPTWPEEWPDKDETKLSYIWMKRDRHRDRFDGTFLVLKIVMEYLKRGEVRSRSGVRHDLGHFFPDTATGKKACNRRIQDVCKMLSKDLSHLNIKKNA